MIIFKNISKIRIQGFIFSWLALLALPTQASFIESTVGTAVVNDATASYFNPAALVLMKNRQIIPQWTVANFRTRFTGQSTLLPVGITESGSSSSSTSYHSPAFYFGLPATNRIILGLAVVSNSANRSAEENAILRYAQSSNNIQDLDVVPAVAIKINDFFSIGGGVNFSYANFNLHPITRFPASNISDSQSNNQSDGTGLGGNIGCLLKLGPATVMGFNYRSLTTYRLSGKSVYEGNPQVVSNNYHFTMRTPARSVFSMNHFFTKKFGLITTIQRIQWSAITNIHINDIASVSGTTPVIVDGVSPFYLSDSWVFTLGSHYRITPKWILRVAGTYNQSPSNPHYQVSNGDSVVLGASTGYEINKTITIDGSYAHVFLKDQSIDIAGSRYLIQGVNSGSRDSVSAKLTFNV
jgi:long-chain fatty acid transport protein